VPLGEPSVSCSWSNGGNAPATISCSIVGGYIFVEGDTWNWTINNVPVGTGPSMNQYEEPSGDYTVQLFVTRGTASNQSSPTNYPLN
jgi:hypothetical protein